MKLPIDLNADLGEGVPNENELLALSAPPASPADLHAGDPLT